MNASPVKEINAQTLKDRLDKNENLVLVDVRENHELAVCKLDNIVHIPLGELPTRLQELNKYKDKQIVVYCRSGKRSERACQFLTANGFNAVLNLEGGILAWAQAIDPSMPSY